MLADFWHWSVRRQRNSRRGHVALVAALAAMGHLNEHGAPYSAKSVRAIFPQKFMSRDAKQNSARHLATRGALDASEP